MAMTLRLTPDQDAALTRIATAAGISKHEATIRLITDADTELDHDARVAAASAVGLERYATLLERLSR